MVPEIDAQLAQLNRDYEINKKNYEALVSRRESATMSGDLESVGALAEFRIVDPPRVSPQPVGPSRLVLMVALLFISIGAGGAVSFAATRVWPTFFDGQSLRQATGLPFLGSVSLRPTEEGRKSARRGVAGFLAGVFGLLVAHAAVIVVMLLFAARAN